MYSKHLLRFLLKIHFEFSKFSLLSLMTREERCFTRTAQNKSENLNQLKCFIIFINQIKGNIIESLLCVIFILPFIFLIKVFVLKVLNSNLYKTF
jgi:hypothetical protein